MKREGKVKAIKLDRWMGIGFGFGFVSSYPFISNQVLTFIVILSSNETMGLGYFLFISPQNHPLPDLILMEWARIIFLLVKKLLVL